MSQCRSDVVHLRQEKLHNGDDFNDVNAQKKSGASWFQNMYKNMWKKDHELAFWEMTSGAHWVHCIDFSIQEVPCSGADTLKGLTSKVHHSCSGLGDHPHQPLPNPLDEAERSLLLGSFEGIID